MKQIVSKERTKRTRSREKRAGKAAIKRRGWREHPALGLGIGCVAWLTTLIIMHSDAIGGHHWQLQGAFDLAGHGLIMLAGMLSIGLFLRLANPRFLTQNLRILLLAIICVLSIAPARLLLYASSEANLFSSDVLPFLMTFALAPICATILVNGVTGVAAGFWSTLCISLLLNQGLPIFMAGLIATLVASLTAEQVRTRAKVVRVGIIAGVTQITCVFGVTALNLAQADPGTILRQGAACVVSGFLSALLALLIIPIFERAFRITTDITWLELADLGHPLLQRLAMEAPGTYHHSLVVSNLAQAAADEIGANALLARVCSYFHDIGKLNKPEFFSENMRFQHSPHDNLPPSMSMLIITSHVKEGVSMALHHHLPDRCIDVIREHHGTSVVSYFHRKALSQAELGENARPGGVGVRDAAIEEWNYRYDGPKPTSRESGIICLADPVEAASRSLEKPSPANIEGLIDDIIDERVQDGQLDNSGLTLAELTKIKHAFKFTLTSIFHGRTPYPKNGNAPQQSANKIQPSPADATKPPQMDGGTLDSHAQV